jgi:hypothetical protein
MDCRRVTRWQVGPTGRPPRAPISSSGSAQVFEFWAAMSARVCSCSTPLPRVSCLRQLGKPEVSHLKRPGRECDNPIRPHCVTPKDEAGVFRIARWVAKDRVIFTVDPEARHGHKTAARGFDWCKGHLAIDPDTEIITATTVTAGSVGDAERVTDLLADDLSLRLRSAIVLVDLRAL